jgi:hypothetical protein
VRVVNLPVRAGRHWPPHGDGPIVGTQVIPALAVDVSGGRAYVFPAAGSAIEVDLATAKVRSHRLAQRGLAKALNGPDRVARWLGNGLVALTGITTRARLSGTTLESDATPAGLALVDVGTWKARMIDRDATSVIVAGGLLLARGYAQSPPTSIRAYDFTGRLRFELTDLPRDAWLQAGQTRAYVGNRVHELPSGRLLRRLPADPRVRLLPTDGSQFPL